VDLLADVGNSRVHLAAFDGGELVRTLATPHDAPAEQAWDAFWPGEAPTRLAAVSVRGSRLDALGAWTERRFGRRPRLLGDDLPAGLPLQVDRPEQVGLDRVANGLWAVSRYPGRDVVVVDLGTAVTFDVVSAAGAFVGGSIAPGLATGAWALHERTRGRLPQVDVLDAPPALGLDTEGCLRAGLFYGLVGLVQATCAQLEAELGVSLHVAATGGDAERVAAACPRVDEVVPHATLLGLLRALDAEPGA
jgi:type III pantothenate kinase